MKPKALARSRIALERQQHKGFGLQWCLVFNPERGGATGDPLAWASPSPSGRRWQSRAPKRRLQGWGHGCAAAADSGCAAATSDGVTMLLPRPPHTALAGASHRKEGAPTLT